MDHLYLQYACSEFALGICLNRLRETQVKQKIVEQEPLLLENILAGIIDNDVLLFDFDQKTAEHAEKDILFPELLRVSEIKETALRESPYQQPSQGEDRHLSA